MLNWAVSYSTFGNDYREMLGWLNCSYNLTIVSNEEFKHIQIPERHILSKPQKIDQISIISVIWDLGERINWPQLGLQVESSGAI